MTVPVTVKPRFIGLDSIKHYTLSEGMTVHEMAVAIGDELPAAFWTGDGVICVGDRRVPQEYWTRVKPRIIPGREIAVTFHVVPQGREDLPGILTTIAGVALTAAGIIFQQPWLTSLGVGVTLSGVGMLLAPPPPQPKQGQEDKTLQAGITGNIPANFEWLPRILGRMVASPPYLIRPYTVYSRRSVKVAGAVGYVGRHAISNVRVNGALADSMSNFSYQTRKGLASDTALTLGNKWVWEETEQRMLSNFDLKTDNSARDELFDQSVTANSYSQFQTFLTRSGDQVDKVVIRVFMPQGMVSDTDTNNKLAIPVRVEFRQRGSSTWIEGPELHFFDENKGNQEIRQNITFLWQADGSGRLASPNLDRVSYVGYSVAANPILGHSYTADPYFYNGSSWYAYHVGRDDDGFTIYLNPATFPKGHYEFRIKRGLAYQQGLFTNSSYQYNGSGQNANFFEHYMDGSVAKVRVEQFKYRGDIHIEVFQTWHDEYPLQDALTGGVPLTLIGFEGRDIKIEEVSAQFDSELPIFSGGNWNTIAATRNPAAAYRHVLLDVLNADPRDTAIVDSSTLGDWYNFCATNGYECNALSSANEPDILAMIASAGWAGQRSHEQWEVILERDTSSFAITQLFTPLNSSNYTASKAFADLPHAFNIEFADEANDYNLATVVVYAPGFSSITATRFETIRLDGFTNQAKAVARATNLLRSIYARQTERRIEVGIESLVSSRGDVVGLAHDLRDQHIWFGRVKSVLTSGANVTGLVLNGKALLTQSSPPFGAAIRYMSSQVVLKGIINGGDSATIMFTTPFAIPAGNVLRKGCLVSIGQMSSEARRCRVSNIIFKDEITATVALVDEAPEIYTGTFGSRGVALGTSLVLGATNATGTSAGAGLVNGAGQANGVSGAFGGTVAAVGNAAGTGSAAAVGQFFGTFTTIGLADGFGDGFAEGATGAGIAAGAGLVDDAFGAASAEGDTITTTSSGLAGGTGTVTGVSAVPVPSLVPIFKTVLTDTANKVAGESYTFNNVDIGTAHAKRVVIVAAAHGGSGNVLGTPTIDGNNMGGGGLNSLGANIWHRRVAAGATCTIDFPISISSTTRIHVGVWIAYPDDLTPIYSASVFGGAPTTTDAVINDVSIVVDGFVIAFGHQWATLGSFTGTWNGIDTPTENFDQQNESASSFAGWSFKTTETNSTRDFTMAESVSGQKGLVLAAWGPPPA